MSFGRAPDRIDSSRISDARTTSGLETPSNDLSLPEVPSTRVLIATARLIARGIPPQAACRSALAGPLTDDPDVLAAVHDLVAATI